MNTCTLRMVGTESFDSDVLMQKLPVSIGGWAKRAMIVEAALVFARPYFSNLQILTADEDIIALADLVDEVGVQCFKCTSALNINIQNLVDDYRTGDLDIDDFERQLQTGVINPDYLSSSKPFHDELPVHLEPGYFSVDFNRSDKSSLFCSKVLRALSAGSEYEPADDNLPDDRTNLERWLS